MAFADHAVVSARSLAAIVTADRIIGRFRLYTSARGGP